MRFRLLACLPVALLLVGLLFASVASFVYATPRTVDVAADGPVVLRLGDSSCDVLRREIHALSHTVSRCELFPECQGSPLLCPRALDANVEREYERLRDALHEQCGLPRSLLDFAWELGEQVDLAVDGGEGCELAHDGWEAAVRGVARPSSYSF